MSKKSQHAGKAQASGAKLVPTSQATGEQYKAAVAKVEAGEPTAQAIKEVGVQPTPEAIEQVEEGAQIDAMFGGSPDTPSASGDAGLDAELAQMLGGDPDAIEQVTPKPAHAHAHKAHAKPVTAKGNDLLAMAAAYTPAVGNGSPLSAPTQLGNGVFAQVSDGILTLAIPLSKRMREAAKPSGEKGDGALCMMATTRGFMALGIEDLKINVALGFPNPHATRKSTQAVRTR